MTILEHSRRPKLRGLKLLFQFRRFLAINGNSGNLFMVTCRCREFYRNTLPDCAIVRITRDVGNLATALTLCHPERSARERARESKDPGAAVGDDVDAGNSTETLFCFSHRLPDPRSSALIRGKGLPLSISLMVKLAPWPATQIPKALSSL